MPRARRSSGGGTVSDQEPGGVAAEQSEPPAALDGRRERADVSRVPALGCFVALELAAGAAFLVWGRRLWFRNDDWDFLVTRRAGSLHDLFAPHTGHWVTLPILAYRVWWSIFGLRDFVAYQVLSVGLHLVAAYLLRIVMRRSGGTSLARHAGGGMVRLFRRR